MTAELPPTTPDVVDPKREATRADIRRLTWVLALVWLALAAFTAIAQRFLGWRLAAGLIGGAGVLFTIGLVLVAVASVAASNLESEVARRAERETRSSTD